MINNTAHVVWLENLRRTDVPRVGDKNAPLGEMLTNLAGRGVNVPLGFAPTAGTFGQLIEANDLQLVISSAFTNLDDSEPSLAEVELTIRRATLHGGWPKETTRTIRLAYDKLDRRTG